MEACMKEIERRRSKDVVIAVFAPFYLSSNRPRHTTLPKGLPAPASLPVLSTRANWQLVRTSF
jgi:hypothetical protein